MCNVMHIERHAPAHQCPAVHSAATSRMAACSRRSWTGSRRLRSSAKRVGSSAWAALVRERPRRLGWHVLPRLSSRRTGRSSRRGRHQLRHAAASRRTVFTSCSVSSMVSKAAASRSPPLAYLPRRSLPWRSLVLRSAPRWRAGSSAQRQ